MLLQAFKGFALRDGKFERARGGIVSICFERRHRVSFRGF